MRIELQEIEQIENYLMKKLNSSENIAFENQLSGDTNLQSNVEFQRNLMEGIKRIGVKKAIKKGKKKYKTKRALKFIITITLIITAIAAVTYVINENRQEEVLYCSCNEREITTENQYADYAEVATKNCVDTCSVFENTLYNNPVIIPENDSLSSDANSYLDQELFEIQTDRDTVIESEDGIIVYIPAHAFNTNNAQVDFIIQEALTPEDVIYAGLSTITENGEELETGGMFYFDAYSKGQRLELKKELTVDIPTNTTKMGMQLYDGVKNDAGNIVWNNPKPIRKPLVPVDILSLDFYPPNYENKMEGWGYLNKRFKDSLYYSFAFDCPDNIRNKENEFYPSSLENDIDTTAISSISPIGMFMPIPQDEIASDNLLPNNIDEVIQWNFSVSYSGNIATITMTANQKKGWHIYSQNQPDGAVSHPTRFAFTPNDDYTLIGKTEETGAKLFDNDGFPERSFHGNKAIFKQKIKMNSENEFEIDLDYEYMACKTACLPPEFRNIKITINGKNNSICDDIGINPASIKTIWNRKFNNTNLATKEFGKRMPWIHKTCDNSILELYVNNLNSNLSTVDSMVMKKLNGSLAQKFAEFALLDESKVEMTTKAAKKLNAYYNTKRLAIQKAIRLTNADYWKEQNKLDKEFETKTDTSNQRNNTNRATINKQELQYNIDRVYSELKMKKKDPPTSNLLVFSNGNSNTRAVDNIRKNASPIIKEQRPFIRTNITSMGWKNIDRLMALRLGQNAKFKGNGRTVIVSYSSVEIQLKENKKYDKINVYVVPNKFNTYQKLKEVNGSYNYRMNNALTYDIIVIAWKEDGLYYYNRRVNKRLITPLLNPVSKIEWENNIQTRLASINNMAEELNYLNYTKKDQYRKNRNAAKQNLRSKVKPFIFPCQVDVFEEIQDDLLSDTTGVIGTSRNEINANFQPISTEL